MLEDTNSLDGAYIACVRRFANGTNGMTVPSEISPLAAIGTWYTSVYQRLPMVNYQWFLPLVANLADSIERRQNYQRAK